jgi:hypothetical protein
MSRKTTTVWRATLAAVLALAGPLATLSAVAAVTAPSEAHARSCGAGSYVNSRGNCVRRPVQSTTAPRGASAQCRDGSWSFSQSRRGTCSHHGGVARWL